MADWLKVRHALVRSAKIRMLMRELHCNKMTALGLAITWLCWVDEQTSDGKTHLTPDELADELGFRGCAEALCAIGWAALGEDGCVVALEFGKHCGASSKERSENARYQAEYRLRNGKAESKGKSKEKSKGGSKEKILREPLPEENRIEFNDTGMGSSTVCGGGAPLPAPPPDGFKGWLSALCEAHPSARQSRVLAPDVEAEARAAFVRCPQAAAQAGLLRAYFDDRMQEDRYHKPFYRPTGQGRFFHDLEDVLAHAVRWAKESGWGRKRKAARAAEGGKGAEAPCSDGAAASEEEREAFFKELRGDLR